jgi:hypothetical protein
MLRKKAKNPFLTQISLRAEEKLTVQVLKYLMYSTSKIFKNISNMVK